MIFNYRVAHKKTSQTLALKNKTLQPKKIKLNIYIFSEQTFVDYVHRNTQLISYTLTKILKEVVPHVKIQKNHKVFSQLSADNMPHN